MNWDTASKIIVAALTVVGGLAELFRRGGGSRRRAQLKADIDLLSSLPDNSTVKKRLLQHVDGTIERLIQDQEELTRDPTGIVLAAIFLAAAIGLGILAIRSPGLWWLWIPVVFFGVFGLVGMSQDAVRRKRDAKGRALRDK